MADKKPSEKPSTASKAATKTSNKTTVTKVSVVSTEPKKRQKVSQDTKNSHRIGFLRSIGNYFSGAWYELRQVRWPDRKASWGLTLAVILFSLFFAGIILGLDFVFQLLFKKILL